MMLLLEVVKYVVKIVQTGAQLGDLSAKVIEPTTFVVR